ncbi:MAG: protein translocase subunit SecD [Armatimonadetes bacterium]|nr:protein translocase subunit SecD [Armatimonadota bacterium]
MQSKNPLFLVIVVVLTALSIWGYQARDYQYGLDVVGGARFIFELDKSDLTPEQLENTTNLQARVQKILESRVSSSIGVVEGNVQAKGTDQFIVELPNFKDIEKARQVLQTSAKITVYHAKTVSTAKRSNKQYSQAGENKEGGSPYVTFATRTDSSKELTPGMPEYKKMIDSWDPILAGDEVADASVQVVNGQYQPNFRFNAEGAKKLEAWSRRYSQEEENIAFVLDDVVLSIAPLKKGAILSDQAFIDGDFEAGYVTQLTTLIKSGSLPVKLNELASQNVDPTIGKFALNEIITGGAIAMAIVCVFLIIYYAVPGVLATIAMALYTLFTLTVLKMIGATFSLAAIAAFILSVGMAVDANILVFERMKEEIKAGRKLLTAIDLGFKRALTAIVDSNVCTIITSAVLWFFGTGPVKGFATTLIIGVAISFFTAITVTRSLLLGVVSLGFFTDTKWYAVNRNWFGERLAEGGEGSKPWKIIGQAKKYFLISAVLIVAGWIFIPMGGIKKNVEFQGGFEAEYAMTDANLSAEAIRDNLEKAGYKGANLKFAETGAGAKRVYITLPETADLKAGDEDAKQRIAEAAGLSAEDGSLNAIGPTIRDEVVRNAVLGLVLSSALIVLYLAARFGVALGGLKNGLKFGLSAVSALLHDVIFIIGMSALVGYFLGWEISALFITAMLTVIGFSVHDTIIIFDRIRENLRRAKGGDNMESLMDRSINQTIARSINTSFTAVLPLAVLLFKGTPTPELKFMILTMLLGIAVGTYSSIFNASPVLYLWDKAIMKKKGEGEGLLAQALKEQKMRIAMTVGGTAAGEPGVDTGAYGTIKRKTSVVEQAGQILDDDYPEDE